jgi:hypothetical protein
MNTTKSTFKISARILDHLGISAYNSIRKSISELVVNAYDADATEVRISIPDVIGESSVIEIDDNGNGMSSADISNDYLFIGRDKRTDTGEKTSKGRLVIGNKGIGKFAGFGVASIIQVISNKDGVQSRVTLDRTKLNDIESLSQQEIPISSAKTEAANGTKIRLLALNPDISLSSAEVLRRHLFRVLPQKPDFKVLVNDVESTAEEIPGTRYEINEIIDNQFPINGFYIITNAKQKQPGLSIRVRGRIVTEPSLFGLSARSHRLFTLDKIAGELNADFLDPPDAKQRSLINTSRDGFIEDSAHVEKLYIWANDYLNKILRGLEEEESEKRAQKLLKIPGIDSRLKRMPPHVRSTAIKVVRGVISKLGNVDDNEIVDLVEWIVRYFESNILRELMKAIIAADAHEAEKLASLVSEWGLQQVNSVTEIIKNQIEIITKLEELVTSEETIEIELHKLVEMNLWLVREGLELWSSDKPLKTVLEGEIEKNYKDKENLRPDIVCRSRDSGNQAIILEFKRPSEIVKMEHVTQALSYKTILKKHRPNMKFDTFVVGRSYSHEVLDSQEALNDVFLWSYEEILQKARIRFESILNILGRE